MSIIKKESSSLCQKAHTQICYPELFCPNLRILNVPLDVQVLVLIVSGRYIFTKKENSSLLFEVVCEPFCTSLPSMQLDLCP